MQHPIRPWRAALVGSLAVGLVLSVNGIGQAATPHGLHGAAARQHALNFYLHAADGRTTANHMPDGGDLAGRLAQHDAERTAPAGFLSGDALVSAQQQAAARPATGGAWQEFSNKPFNGEPSDFKDPFWSNTGAGFSLVGGRTTALAVTPGGAWFAGTADGGLWRSFDQGQHWSPLTDTLPTLSIGALAVDPVDGSLWIGTGEANVSSDTYAGIGVYRAIANGTFFQRVGDASGGNPLASRTVFRIAFDPKGNAYAATDNGLFRYSVATRSWSEVLDPAGPTDFPPYDQQVTDVAVQPGSGGKVVIAAIGWHGPGNTQNNGFYASTNGGVTFAKVTPAGDINAGDIGRTTFAYSADGSKLYAVVQSPSLLAAGAESALLGIFVSSGHPAGLTGPWTMVADAAKLAPPARGCRPEPPGCRPFTTRTWPLTPATPTTCTPGSRSSTSPPTAATPG